MQRWLRVSPLVVTCILTACHRPVPPVSDVLYADAGFLCTASDVSKPNKQVSAWARKENVARAYALSRCQSTSKQIVSCRIKECLWTGTTTEISESRWYTCYINNHNELGVWIGTSHDRLKAVKWAFDRCLLFSGKPKGCYVNYCRLW